jgi:hypothetical protein
VGCRLSLSMNFVLLGSVVAVNDQAMCQAN